MILAFVLKLFKLRFEVLILQICIRYFALLLLISYLFCFLFCFCFLLFLQLLFLVFIFYSCVDMEQETPTGSPLTPKRNCTLPLVSVFSPCAPIQSTTSPCPHRPAATLRSMVLPTGCDLIVRGIGVRKALSDPVKLHQQSVHFVSRFF